MVDMNSRKIAQITVLIFAFIVIMQNALMFNLSCFYVFLPIGEMCLNA